MQHGALNQFHMMERARNLSDLHSKEIIMPVIKRNAYYLHSENLLAAMITDENVVIRRLAWKKIAKAREQKKTAGRSRNVRFFVIPLLDFDATTHHQAIQCCRTFYRPRLRG